MRGKKFIRPDSSKPNLPCKVSSILGRLKTTIHIHGIEHNLHYTIFYQKGLNSNFDHGYHLQILINYDTENTLNLVLRRKTDISREHFILMNSTQNTAWNYWRFLTPATDSCFTVCSCCSTWCQFPAESSKIFKGSTFVDKIHSKHDKKKFNIRQHLSKRQAKCERHITKNWIADVV